MRRRPRPPGQRMPTAATTPPAVEPRRDGQLTLHICESPFMSVVKSYPCAGSECSGYVEIAIAGTGTCPVCRLAEVLDANTYRLRVDAAATLDEERLARAEHDSYLSTTPLPFGQDRSPTSSHPNPPK